MKIICPNCGALAEMHHLHDEAHGIAGTHMAGSERYECNFCGHSIHKSEGERLGLRYICDTTREGEK